MSGFITRREVVRNRRFILNRYGREFYRACLKSEGTTFLGLLVQYGKI